MKKIYASVFGCPSNIADFEIASGLLEQAGFEIVGSPEEADINLIMTCVVKLPTEMRMIQRIQFLTKLNKPLIVGGCMPAVMMKKIESINPNASMIGPHTIQNIVSVVKKTLDGERLLAIGDLKQPKLCLPRIEKRKGVHITQISTGCNFFCSYCIVRLVKGKLFSYPIDMIIKDVNDAVKAGNKEIWITSQDTAAYSYRSKNLPHVLKEICKIDGEFRIRVGMMNPNNVKLIMDELIEVYKNEKIFKFLHLPVQSFSPRVLKIMKRGYVLNTVLEIINKFCGAFPDLTFSTDIITGFPTENNLDAKETIRFLKKVKPDIVNISKFGARPGTEAAKLRPLSSDIINKRSKELFDLVKSISLEKNQKWLGWSGKCLVDERGTKKHTWICRNFAYKPIVFQSSKDLLGKFINLKVTDVKSNYLIGKLI